MDTLAGEGVEEGGAIRKEAQEVDVEEVTPPATPTIPVVGNGPRTTTIIPVVGNGPQAREDTEEGGALREQA